MLITAIEPQVKNASRYNLFIDGSFAFGISEQVCAEFALRAGQKIDKTTLAAVQGFEEQQKALDYAFLLLSYRNRSCAEIGRRLREKGFNETVISDATAKLLAGGYLDDHSFAKQWIENRLRTKPMGQRRLRSELLQKGIKPAVITECIDKLVETADEEATAIELVRHRFGDQVSVLARETLTRRAAGYLERRGYSFSVVKKALAELFTDRQV